MSGIGLILDLYHPLRIVVPIGYRVGKPPTQTHKTTQRVNLSVSGIGYLSGICRV